MSIIEISNGGLTAKIKSLGAELCSLQLEGHEYLWQADPDFWPRHAPVLFPIVGSLRHDEASSPKGPIHLKRHGLARLFEHEVISQTEDSVTFKLTSSAETLKLYPYNFELQLSYSIELDAYGPILKQNFHVLNSDEVELPFSVGAHPAFRVPLDEGEAFSDYKAFFCEEATLESPSLNLETGLFNFAEKVPVLTNSDELSFTHELFDVDTLVLEDVPDSALVLAGPAGRGIELYFPDFKYVGLWSAANNANFIAIEPWTGLATCEDEDDSILSKRNICRLEAGKSQDFSLWIRPFEDTGDEAEEEPA